MTVDDLKAAGLTPGIIKQLGLAIESGGEDEESQREAFGDATVDWINEASTHITFDESFTPSWAEA